MKRVIELYFVAEPIGIGGNDGAAAAGRQRALVYLKGVNQGDRRKLGKYRRANVGLDAGLSSHDRPPCTKYTT